MTDRYQFSPDIHDEYQQPAHRCENCGHMIPGTLTTTYPDGATEEHEHFICMHDDCFCAVGKNNHCNYWEEAE